MNKNISFKIKTVAFPRIESLFIDKPLAVEFQQSYRIEGLIVDDKNLRLLFGLKLVSTELVNGKTPKIQVTIEAIADFEFDDAIPSVSHISEIPLAGNMLALIYPFIREKVNYCLSNNGLAVFLPPINTIQVVKESEGSAQYKVVDARQSIADSEKGKSIKKEKV